MPVNLSGPFFDGRRDTIMRGIIKEVEEDLAKATEIQVVRNLIAKIKVPTPHYWTQVETRGNPGGEGLSVWDSYIIYGPWLEGVGSRNFPKTRFKGYASFRRAATAVQRRAHTVANKTLRIVIRRLN